MVVSEASLPCSSEFMICSPATDAPLQNRSILPKQGGRGGGAGGTHNNIMGDAFEAVHRRPVE